MKPYEIYETKQLVNNWEKFTGRFRVQVECSKDMIAFNLPGKGGPVTKKMAAKIRDLWESGKSAGEISMATGCEIAS